MICRVCGQRHLNREAAAEAHSPKIVTLPMPIEEPTESINTAEKSTQQQPPISKTREQKETVKYRGRIYEGIRIGDKVEITLSNGDKRLI